MVEIEGMLEAVLLQRLLLSNISPRQQHCLVYGAYVIPSHLSRLVY